MEAEEEDGYGLSIIMHMLLPPPSESKPVALYKTSKDGFDSVEVHFKVIQGYGLP